MSSVPDAAVAAGYSLPPLTRATAESHLRRAKHAVYRLCEGLRTLAEHAVLFAASPNPHLPGSPDLLELRAELQRYYNLALLAAIDTGRFRHEGRYQWEPFAPYALLRGGGERPPQPVEDMPYTFLAVIRLVTRVQMIGWNEPGRLRVAGDPWHHETPAERLQDAARWRLPPDPPLPYFGDKAVYDEFVAAVTREFDKAEEALARLPSDLPNRAEAAAPVLSGPAIAPLSDHPAVAPGRGSGPSSDAEGQNDPPKDWAGMSDSMRAVLTVLRTAADRLDGPAIASASGYKYGSLRHHFGPLQSWGYIDKKSDGYKITIEGIAIMPV